MMSKNFSVLGILIFLNIFISFSPLVRNNYLELLLLLVSIFTTFFYMIFSNNRYISKKNFEIYIIIVLLFSIFFFLTYLRDGKVGLGIVIILLRTTLSFLLGSCVYKEMYIEKIRLILYNLCLISLFLSAVAVLFPNIVDYLITTSRHHSLLIHNFYLSNNIYNNRNMGIAWEPGAFQVLLNYGLALSLYKFKDIKKGLVFLLGIASTFSTTGILIMLVNLFGVLVLKRELRKKLLIILLAMSLCFVNSSFRDMITNKVVNKIRLGKTPSYSTLIRKGQMYSDLMDAKNNIVLGTGTRLNEEIRRKNFKQYLKKEKLLEDAYLKKILNTEEAVISTNSYTYIISKFGLLISFVIMFYFFKVISFPFSVLLLSIVSENLILSSFMLVFIFLEEENTKIKKEFYCGIQSKTI